MAKLIEKELAKDGEEPASKMTASSASATWQDTAKSFQKALGEVVQHANEAYRSS